MGHACGGLTGGINRTSEKTYYENVVVKLEQVMPEGSISLRHQQRGFQTLLQRVLLGRA
jgi:hypothetical protein